MPEPLSAQALLTDDPAIAADLEHLLKNDEIFAAYFPQGYAVKRLRGDAGMAGLIRIIIGQQVSTAAARSLWTKFTDRYDPDDPLSLIEAGDENLLACGLSRQKIAYIRGLARAMAEQTLRPDSWRDKDDAAVIAEITALKGFGLWSAQMALMFSLARRDIWPYGDLGIQNGLKIYLKRDIRPDLDEAKKAHKHFKSRGTAASLLLWSIKDGGI